jgi:hypothetical protein
MVHGSQQRLWHSLAVHSRLERTVAPLRSPVQVLVTALRVLRILTVLEITKLALSVK